jgi:glycosyltransferase involved in cell wall biosynthesis
MFLQISLQKSGGGAVDSFELSQSLCRQGFKHVVLLSAYNELRFRWSENEFRRIIWVTTYKSNIFSFVARNVLLGWLSVLFQVWKLGPTTIYATHFHPWLVPVSWLKRLLKFKFFYTAHENPYQPKEKSSRMSLFLEKYLMHRADVVITHSEFIKSQINRFVKIPIHVLPLGAYVSYFEHFKKVPSSDGVLRLLFFGRMEPYKGLSVLIEALALLKEKKLPCKATVAGRGDVELDSLEKAKELGVNIIHRWLSDEELAVLFGESDVLVVPYIQASQSGVVSLALASHLPVIASRVGGLEEQVRDGTNGLLIAPGDATTLAEAVEKLISKPALLAQLSEGTRWLASEVFSWDKNATYIIELSKSRNAEIKNYA